MPRPLCIRLHLVATMSKPATTAPTILELSERELDAFESVDAAMESAEDAIDLQFGAGYAERHPELIGDYLQAVAITYQANTVGDRLEQVLQVMIAGIIEGARHG